MSYETPWEVRPSHGAVPQQVLGDSAKLGSHLSAWFKAGVGCYDWVAALAAEPETLKKRLISQVRPASRLKFRPKR